MIQELETNFIGVGDVKGFIFNQIKVTKKGYIYLVESEGTTHYEIFLRKITPVCIDFENRIYSETDFKVKYPKQKDFGIWAWSTKSLTKANEFLSNF